MRRGTLLLLLVASCVRVRTASIDYEARQVTTCGNRHATQADLEMEARRACPVVIPLRCAEEITGVFAMGRSRTSGNVTGSPYGASYRSDTRSYAAAEPIRGTCCTYQCQ